MTDTSAFAFAGQRIEPVSVGAAGIVTRLHQGYRRRRGKPLPLRGELGQGNYLSLHSSVADLLPGRMGFFPQLQAVVVHHSGTPKYPGQRPPLPWGRVQAVSIADQHKLKKYPRPMTTDGDQSR